MKSRMFHFFMRHWITVIGINCIRKNFYIILLEFVFAISTSSTDLISLSRFADIYFGQTQHSSGSFNENVKNLII